MADDRGCLREVAWQEICPGLSLFRTFRLAIGFRMLLLAALAMLGTTAGWRLIGHVFSGTSDPQLKGWIAADSVWPWETPAAKPAKEGDLDFPRSEALPPDLLPSAGPALSAPKANSGGSSYVDSQMAGPWRAIGQPFWRLFQPEVKLAGFAYSLLLGLWALLIWAFFGGAITRMAAVSLAREERTTVRTAVEYAKSKWYAYFTAPLFPLIGVLLAGAPMALIGGLLMRADLGVLVAAILWPLFLVGGLFMAVLLLGLLFGWPLMWATISVEGTDSFDALSRAYAYVFQRPLHYLIYALVAALLGALGWLLVWTFADGVVYLTSWAVSWGSGGARMEAISEHVAGLAPVYVGWGASLIGFWNGLVRVLALGFVYSFFWTASTAIYFLLRLHVDAAEMDEVHVSPQEEAFGLPPLEKDAAGVPVVGDEGRPGAESPLGPPGDEE
ncbi:MAG: hypothetical protein ACYC35_12800 [Pirellulales bacterium]